MTVINVAGGVTRLRGYQNNNYFWEGLIPKWVKERLYRTVSYVSKKKYEKMHSKV